MNFEVRKHQFQDVVNAIKGVMFDLEDTWTGVAEQTYEAQVRGLLKNLQTILQAMEGAKGKLELATKISAAAFVVLAILMAFAVIPFGTVTAFAREKEEASVQAIDTAFYADQCEQG